MTGASQATSFACSRVMSGLLYGVAPTDLAARLDPLGALREGWRQGARGTETAPVSLGGTDPGRFGSRASSSHSRPSQSRATTGPSTRQLGYLSATHK